VVGQDLQDERQDHEHAGVRVHGPEERQLERRQRQAGGQTGGAGGHDP
jgi:hypothetical protein